MTSISIFRIYNQSVLIKECSLSGCTLFAFTNIVNMMMRIANGIFTVDLLPVVLLGFVGITVGKVVGLRILDKTNPDRIKKLVYAFVGISGVLSLI